MRPNSRSPAATRVPPISSRVMPAARTVKRCGPSALEVIVPVHRADQISPVRPSGARGMPTVGSTTVRAGSPSGVSPFQYCPSRPVPSPPGGVSTSVGTGGSAASPKEPWANATRTAAPARAVIPSRGVTRRSGDTRTHGEPAITNWASSRAVPTTASEPIRSVSSGSRPSRLVSRTSPSVAIRVARATCSGVLARAGRRSSGTGCWSRPASKMANRVRRTISSSRSAGIRPEVSCSAVRPSGTPSPGRSRPALAAATGSRTACRKSGATNPSQPQSRLRVRRMPGCWQA
jgi:hypothetical protein